MLLCFCYKLDIQMSAVVSKEINEEIKKYVPRLITQAYLMNIAQLKRIMVDY